MKRIFSIQSAIIVVVAAVLLSLTPASCQGRVSISVEVYGGIGIGCVSMFFYIFQSHEIGLALSDEMPALLHLRGERVRWGIPLPQQYLPASEERESSSPAAWSLPILQWEF